MSNLIASDDAQTIQTGSRVELHFELRLPDGSVIDGNFDKAPAVLVVGDGNLLPGFEAHLLGLKPGAEREFQVEPDAAFGPRRDENIQRLPRAKFAGSLPEGDLEPGLMVSFDAPGGELPGVIHEVQGEQVLVDFNHPLAGYVIIFVVHVLGVAAGPTAA